MPPPIDEIGGFEGQMKLPFSTTGDDVGCGGTRLCRFPDRHALAEMVCISGFGFSDPEQIHGSEDAIVGGVNIEV